eukprot:284815269_4
MRLADFFLTVNFLFSSGAFSGASTGVSGAARSTIGSSSESLSMVALSLPNLRFTILFSSAPVCMQRFPVQSSKRIAKLYAAVGKFSNMLPPLGMYVTLRDLARVVAISFDASIRRTSIRPDPSFKACEICIKRCDKTQRAHTSNLRDGRGNGKLALVLHPIYRFPSFMTHHFSGLGLSFCSNDRSFSLLLGLGYDKLKPLSLLLGYLLLLNCLGVFLSVCQMRNCNVVKQNVKLAGSFRDCFSHVLGHSVSLSQQILR